MKNQGSALAGAGAMLCCLAAGSMWFAPALAEESKSALTATPAPEPLVRLRALTAGGIRKGEVMHITQSSIQTIKATVSGQRQIPKSPSSDYCNTQ